MKVIQLTKSGNLDTLKNLETNRHNTSVMPNISEKDQEELET